MRQQKTRPTRTRSKFDWKHILFYARVIVFIGTFLAVLITSVFSISVPLATILAIATVIQLYPVFFPQGLSAPERAKNKPFLGIIKMPKTEKWRK